MTLTVQLIREARERIRPYVHRTPVLTSHALNERAGAELFFKCENFQRAGAFKARGAHNAVLSLSESEARSGVIAHSSGNHGAALALAARARGIAAYVVMPSNAPEVKKRAVARYGGQVTYCEPTLSARESAVAALIGKTGATLVHPYNDLRVMAGQGTLALELLEDVPELDSIISSVGGGGQLGGVAVAGKGVRSGICVIGAEPAATDDAYRSLQAGVLIPADNSPRSIADGLLTSLGDKAFEVIRRHVDEIATVSDEEIVRAMRLVWDVMKIVIEPSAAVSVAVALERKSRVAGRRVGVVLSGGNVDLDKLPWKQAEKLLTTQASD